MIDNAKVIDWDLCLQIANGKQDFAKEMLAMFLQELPQVQQDVNEEFKARNFTQLANHLHKLLGGCSYCGVPRLKEITAIFEMAVKKNPTSAPLDTLLSKFNQEVAAILEAAKGIELV